MISRYHIFGNIHIDEVSLAAKFHERHLLDAQRFPIGICPCYLCTWIVKMINLEKQCVRCADKWSTGCFEDVWQCLAFINLDLCGDGPIRQAVQHWILFSFP